MHSIKLYNTSQIHRSKLLK